MTGAELGVSIVIFASVVGLGYALGRRARAADEDVKEPLAEAPSPAVSEEAESATVDPVEAAEPAPLPAPAAANAAPSEAGGDDDDLGTTRVGAKFDLHAAVRARAEPAKVAEPSEPRPKKIE